MKLPKATDRRGRPKPQTFLEANAAWTAAVYRLGAEIARAARVDGLVARWERKAQETDQRRRELREQVMGPHYDGL